MVIIKARDGRPFRAFSFLPSQQFVPPFGLRVSLVLNLYPAIPVVFVNTHLSLGHNSFEISSANLFKELLSGAINVLRIQKT